MPLSLLLLTILILLLIARQDLSTRTVSWFLFPLLAICGICIVYSELRSPKILGLYVLENVVFLLLQLLTLKAWWMLGRKRKTRLIDGALGKGDLLFLLAACCFFSPVNFILFYLLSLLFALLLHLLMRRRPAIYGHSRDVALAGLQAGFLLLILAMCAILNKSTAGDCWTIPN